MALYGSAQTRQFGSGMSNPSSAPAVGNTGFNFGNNPWYQKLGSFLKTYQPKKGKGSAQAYLTDANKGSSTWNPVSYSKVAPNPALDPTKAINAAIPGLQERIAASYADAANRTLSGGMRGGAYVNALSQGNRGAVGDFNEMAANKILDASKFNTESQLRADLANQAAGIETGTTNSRGMLEADFGNRDRLLRSAGLSRDFGNDEISNMGSLMDMYSRMYPYEQDNSMQSSQGYQGSPQEAPRPDIDPREQAIRDEELNARLAASRGAADRYRRPQDTSGGVGEYESSMQSKIGRQELQNRLNELIRSGQMSPGSTLADLQAQDELQAYMRKTGRIPNSGRG